EAAEPPPAIVRLSRLLAEVPQAATNQRRPATGHWSRPPLPEEEKQPLRFFRRRRRLQRPFDL
ncbi:hypothetical protein PanWU01x14_180160, partial [Parasponia andersonii]